MNLRLKVWNYAYLALVAAVVLAADQYAKSLVRTHLAFGASWMPIAWLSPYFRFVYTTNTGSACGLLQGGGNLFTLIAFVVIGVILLYYRQIPQGQTAMRVVLGLQLGGALGNLIDRLVYGTVTDFVAVGQFAVFNIADASISVGVALLFLAMVREEWETAGAEGRPEPETQKRRFSLLAWTGGLAALVLLFLYVFCWSRL